ncbi:MAG: exopolyphosphatase, partial [Paracoccaceae bacterium]|nr:exopolyphosphatase [Paracoccaceae bacterium]
VATAAVREAEDGPEFQDLVTRETGLKLWVIDGAEEARLSAQGVLLGWPEAKGIVCDIGGSSMELAVIGDGRIGKRVTSPLGPFRLQQVEGGAKARKKHIEKIVKGLKDDLDTDHAKLYLVGGSWRAIARLDMERRGYPLTVLHEYRMTKESVLDTVDWIAAADPVELRQRTGTSAERMELVPLACEVLGQLVRTFRPKEIDVSSYGIREGLLYEHMPQKLRARDPLIESCRFSEATMARMPGFGKKLFAFLEPLFKHAPPKRLRLIKAACLLHDTTWRAHPDYRAEACFDNATRANLGGLDHPGRVFLGLSLLHRYKNSRAGSRLEPLLTLLTSEEIAEAEVLGKAMRFGAMFAIADPSEAGSLHLHPRKGVLELVLHPKGVTLFGEVAQARFASLAAALKMTTKITVARK